MAFTEKPPILRGTEQEQLYALRDYLFRMAQSLGDAAGAEAAVNVVATVRPDGSRAYDSRSAERTIEDVRKTAQELRALIVKTADDVIAYADSKVEEYNSLYVAQSTFGNFTETIQSTIETTARGVVESYDYDTAIETANANYSNVLNYLEEIDGEIKRGIVLDPDTNQYVTGIAISQNMRFTGQECGASDANNPGDGHTYYYVEANQTFGLYTSTGWQFWIDGHKKGWFSSLDSMLHVSQIVVEQELKIGDSWKLTAAPDGSEFEITYVG